MLTAFLTTTHHPHQKPWHTTHTNNEYHRPNASLMYERASEPPCPLGILTSADLQWKQSASPTRRRRTFFGNSYTAPTPNLQTLQLLGLSVSKAYSTLLCNATCMFQLHPTAPAFDLYTLSSLWKILTIPRKYVASSKVKRTTNTRSSKNRRTANLIKNFHCCSSHSTRDANV